MAKEHKDSKWEGKAIAELKSTTPEQVWPLLEDFCAIHKWLPTINTCRHVEGAYGEPGLVRYCALSHPNEAAIKWCHEKLLSIDPVQRHLRYEIAENNLGITSYVVELKVIEIEGEGDGGCRIEWWFAANPVEGWTFEDLSGTIGLSLETMAKRMEEELQAPNK